MYSTYTSILTIVPGMPQTASSSGYSACTAVISKHLNRASALVDGKLSKRYSVPVTDSCPIIDLIADDIASYYTYRSYYRQDNHNRMEDMKETCEMALATLEQIRNGEIDLVDSSGNVIAERSTGAHSLVDSNTKDYQPFFDVDKETDWHFDDDLLDSILDKR